MAYAREAVARRMEDPEQPLPLLARISDWPSDEPLLTDWLAGTLGLDTEAVAHAVGNGKTLLLLDGLDELPGGNASDALRTHFVQAVNSPPVANGVIVTCREQDYELCLKVRLEGAVTLSPLNDEHIAEYLQKYPDLGAALADDETLRNMARTPLLLSLLTFAYAELARQTQELRQLDQSPRELRDKIFRTYVERRYEHERLKPHRELSFTLEEIYDVLGRVAQLRLSTGVFDRVQTPTGRSRDPADTGITVSIESILGNRAETFINQMQRLHYLISDGRGNVRFIHLLLQEHFGINGLLAIADRILPGFDVGDEAKLEMLRTGQVPKDLLPAVSVENKVSLMIMVILNKLDQDIELQAQNVYRIETTHGLKIRRRLDRFGNLTTISDDVAVETMKLKRLVDKRSQMFDMLHETVDKYNLTAKGIIDSIGR
jgi:hypothetical protein